ncbi:MAG TPA: lytic transglycosylase domain-containing protein [Pyrinomonadaceae bacterium]|nr:lytic transglycosylase domain-containing protein [Pyrinomonadaceae bacterium]
MKLPRNVTLLRPIKFTPLALIGLFLFSNFSDVLLSHALAPLVSAQTTGIPSDIPTSGDPNLDAIILKVGESEGVDPRFIHAVIWQESRYETTARSHAGAQGLMQLMPATAKRFGCKDVNDPTDNITAGTKYLSWLLKRFSGDVGLTLAGYNAGEGSVDKYNGVPPYDETRNYVKVITERYGKSYHPVLAPEEAIQVFHLQTTE